MARFFAPELSVRIDELNRAGVSREGATPNGRLHRAGQVVTRTDIWEHLYDQHDETTSNVVDVYIGYLRNKIDREFVTKLIHTRRGQGYLLGVEA